MSLPAESIQRIKRHTNIFDLQDTHLPRMGCTCSKEIDDSVAPRPQLTTTSSRPPPATAAGRTNSSATTSMNTLGRSLTTSANDSDEMIPYREELNRSGDAIDVVNAIFFSVPQSPAGSTKSSISAPSSTKHSSDNINHQQPPPTHQTGSPSAHSPPAAPPNDLRPATSASTPLLMRS